MYAFMFKGEVLEPTANENVKKDAPPFFFRLFEAIISMFMMRSELYAPLPDPGVLNCDESRSLRGVDMLLASNAGSGDVSLPAELRTERGGQR